MVLAPLLVAAIYVLLVVRSAAGQTGITLDLVAHFEQHGLAPEALPRGWLPDLLAVEDPGFHDHNGVDLTTPGAGLTTITQGLVKIHYFDEFEPGMAKLRQTILAILLDSKLTKRQQLVLFLNTARLGSVDGRRISGFPDAAAAYFGKDFEELTYREFLSLVAMLVGPNRYSVAANPEENSMRVERIITMLAGECAPEGLLDVYYEKCIVEASSQGS